MAEWRTMGEEGMFAEVLRIAKTCVRCGTEWSIDAAPDVLRGTDDGPVCRNRTRCDRRRELRRWLESLAKR